MKTWRPGFAVVVVHVNVGRPQAALAHLFQRPGGRRQHFAEARQGIAVDVIENAASHAGQVHGVRSPQPGQAGRVSVTSIPRASAGLRV